jgi:hypothetical protein
LIRTATTALLVFLIQNNHKVFRQILAAVSKEKKGNQWQKFGRNFLSKPAKPTSLNEIGLSFEHGARIAGGKSVWLRFLKQPYLPVTIQKRFIP